MKITEIYKTADCISDEFTREVIFDSIIDESFIKFLEDRGDLEYFPSFTRPLFRFDYTDHYTLKGILGEKKLRLIINRSSIADSISLFKNLINEYYQTIESISSTSEPSPFI